MQLTMTIKESQTEVGTEGKLPVIFSGPLEGGKGNLMGSITFHKEIGSVYPENEKATGCLTFNHQDSNKLSVFIRSDSPIEIENEIVEAMNRGDEFILSIDTNDEKKSNASFYQVDKFKLVSKMELKKKYIK
jgi:hypothetical protein